MPRVYASSRNEILDAAERVMVSSGLGRLTIDAVAKEAGLSKGAVFHHFESKDALLVALLERLVEESDRDIAAHVAKDRAAASGGSRLRAQIAVAFDPDQRVIERMRAFSLAILEAPMSNPTLLFEARRANSRELARHVADGVDETNALIVQCAIDGLMITEAVGALEITAKQRAALRRGLLALAVPTATTARKTKKAKKP